MLSVEGPIGSTDLRLPSQPNGVVIPPDVHPIYIPITMRRKIFVVNGHMVVGAAGSAEHIAKFIDDLMEKFRKRNIFSGAELQGFLDLYASSKEGKEVFDCIGTLLLAEATDWRGSLTKGLANHRNELSDHYGRVVAIGAGSDSIVEQIQKLDSHYNYGLSQPPNGKVQFPEFEPLARNLTLLANIYWKEFVSPANVFEAWGGAYDLIYQDSRRVFRYLNEYTIFLRVFDVDQAEKGIQLMNVLKYERRPDLSFVAMLNEGRLDLFGAQRHHGL